MQRLLEMLLALAILYAVYALGMKKWNYTFQADREKRKTELKKLGLSNTFYFIHEYTFLVLNLASGGLFSFYWIYKQWQAVLQGFKRLEGGPLKHGAFVRTLGGGFTFFTLAALINRTCEYMRKKTAWPAGLWGTLWFGGCALVFCPVGATYRLTGYLFFCLAPVVYQKRLNALPNEQISPTPKMTEIIASVMGLVVALGVAVGVRVFFFAK